MSAARKNPTPKSPAKDKPDYGGFLPGPIGRPAGGRSADWIPAFLATLRECGVVRYACHAAGVDRATAYERRGNDPEFSAAWQVALDESLDQLEIKARQRAHNSSDLLMIFLLKSHRREVYGDKQEHTLSGGIKIVFENIESEAQVNAAVKVVDE